MRQKLYGRERYEVQGVASLTRGLVRTPSTNREVPVIIDVLGSNGRYPENILCVHDGNTTRPEIMQSGHGSPARPVVEVAVSRNPGKLAFDAFSYCIDKQEPNDRCDITLKDLSSNVDVNILGLEREGISEFVRNAHISSRIDVTNPLACEKLLRCAVAHVNKSLGDGSESRLDKLNIWNLHRQNMSLMEQVQGLQEDLEVKCEGHK